MNKYSVNTKAVKIIFTFIPFSLLLAIIINFCYFGTSNIKVDISFIICSPFALWIFLLLYGKKTMFHRAWELSESGLKIFYKRREIDFHQYSRITKINLAHGYSYRGKKYFIPLPPPVRKEFLKNLQHRLINIKDKT